MWVLIDNYDSFSHILLHYLNILHAPIKVLKNDECDINILENLNPERIIISPGPKRPTDAGMIMEVIARFHCTHPILGVCLGHQAIGEYFGAKLILAKQPMHGKTSALYHCGQDIFKGIKPEIKVMRYHSLILESLNCTELNPLAFTKDGEIMALKHKLFPCYGLQFHPESILTEEGFHILKNWSEIVF